MPIVTYSAADDISGVMHTTATVFNLNLLPVGDNGDAKSDRRYSAFLWFPSIDIPPGATINRARLRLKSAVTASLGVGSTLTVDAVEDATTRLPSDQIDYARGPELAPPSLYSLFHSAGTLSTEGATASDSHFPSIDAASTSLWWAALTTSSGLLNRLEVVMSRQDAAINTGTVTAEIWYFPGDDITAENLGQFQATSDPVSVLSISSSTVTFNFTGGNIINVPSGQPLLIRIRASSDVNFGPYRIFVGAGIGARARDVGITASTTGNPNVAIAQFELTAKPFVEANYHIESLLPAVNNGDNDTRITSHIVTDGATANITLSAPSFVAETVETWGDSGFLLPTTRAFAGAFAAFLQAFIDRPAYAMNRPLTLSLSTTGSINGVTFYSSRAGVTLGTPLLEVDYTVGLLDIDTAWLDESVDPGSPWDDTSINASDPLNLCTDPTAYCVPTGEVCETVHTDADGDPTTTWTDESADPGSAWADDSTDPATPWNDTESS